MFLFVKYHDHFFSILYTTDGFNIVSLHIQIQYFWFLIKSSYIIDDNVFFSLFTSQFNVFSAI